MSAAAFRCGAALLLALLAFSLSAAACTQDTDCAAPLRCLFSGDETEGQCGDAIQSAVDRTEKTRRTLALKDRKSGDVCEFNVDCAVGMNCYKLPGSAEGKCNPPIK